MSDEEFAAKASDCAGYAAAPLDDGVVDRLAATVRRLDEVPEVAELIAALVPRTD